MKKLFILLFLLPCTSVPNNLNIDLQFEGYSGQVTATINNIVAGVLYFTKESPQQGEIWKLLVGDQFNSDEVGTALMEKVMKFFKDQGISEVKAGASGISPAFPSSIPGVSSSFLTDFQFYKKFGFQETPASRGVNVWISKIPQSTKQSLQTAYLSLQQTMKEHPYMTAGVATLGLVALFEYQTGYIRKKLVQFKRAIANKLFGKPTSAFKKQAIIQPNDRTNKASIPSAPHPASIQNPLSDSILS